MNRRREAEKVNTEATNQTYTEDPAVLSVSDEEGNNTPSQKVLPSFAASTSKVRVVDDGPEPEKSRQPPPVSSRAPPPSTRAPPPSSRAPPPASNRAPPASSRVPPPSATTTKKVEETAASRVAADMIPAFRAVLEELDILKALESIGQQPNSFLTMVMSYEAPSSTSASKKAAAKCKFSRELLQRIIDGTYDHGFPDSLDHRVCLAHFGYNPPEGRDPFSLHAIPIETGRSCSACLKKVSGRYVNDESNKQGFHLDDYKAKVLSDAKKWATKKLAEVNKSTNGTVIMDFEGEDENEEAEVSGEDSEFEPYASVKDSKWQKSTGAVLQKTASGSFICVGVDAKKTQRRTKVTKAMRSKLAAEGYDVDPSWMSMR